MKRLSIVIGAILLMAATWRTDFDKAKQEAKQEHKLVLLKFSGSDWCLPCIRMEKNVFQNEAFGEFASGKLIMVQADFPRLAKNKLDKTIAKQNDMLAEQYNTKGHFPLTILLDENGKVLKEWDGYKGEAPEEYIKEIAAFEQ